MNTMADTVAYLIHFIARIKITLSNTFARHQHEAYDFEFIMKACIYSMEFYFTSTLLIKVRLNLYITHSPPDLCYMVCLIWPLWTKEIAWFHQYLRCYANIGTIIFSIPRVITWASSHFANVVFTKVALFYACYLFLRWSALREVQTSRQWRLAQG